MNTETKKAQIPDDPRQLMRVPEVAARLNLAITTVHHMVQRGVLPGFKVGGATRFDREEMETLIKTKFGKAA